MPPNHHVVVGVVVVVVVAVIVVLLLFWVLNINVMFRFFGIIDGMRLLGNKRI